VVENAQQYAASWRAWSVDVNFAVHDALPIIRFSAKGQAAFHNHSHSPPPSRRMKLFRLVFRDTRGVKNLRRAARSAPLGPAELSGPQVRRVWQHSSLFQVFERPATRLIGLLQSQQIPGISP